MTCGDFIAQLSNVTQFKIPSGKLVKLIHFKLNVILNQIDDDYWQKLNLKIIYDFKVLNYKNKKAKKEAYFSANVFPLFQSKLYAFHKQ